MMSGVARAQQRSRVLVSIRGSVAIGYCIGTLDREVLGDLSERVRALTFEGVRGFVCSLERVSHIHFQALEGLFGLHQLMQDAGGQFVIADASPYLRQILDFGGIPERVVVLSERSRALEELQEILPASHALEPAKASVQQTFF